MHKIKEDQEKVIIYQHDYIWRRASAKKPRALGSVILDGNNAQMLMEDMQTF